MKTEDLKKSLIETIELFCDDTEYLMLNRLTEEQLQRMLRVIREELQIVGIKVK